MASLATGAWVCPVLCWVLTFIGAAVGRHAGAVVNLLLAVAQLGLLLAGLVLAWIVLADKEARKNTKIRRSAIAGLIVSGATLALVALTIVASLMWAGMHGR
jgi:hypothetical protein